MLNRYIKPCVEITLRDSIFTSIKRIEYYYEVRCSRLLVLDAILTSDTLSKPQERIMRNSRIRTNARPNHRNDRRSRAPSATLAFNCRGYRKTLAKAF
jgi:hypothetical protein